MFGCTVCKVRFFKHNDLSDFFLYDFNPMGWVIVSYIWRNETYGYLVCIFFALWIGTLRNRNGKDGDQSGFMYTSIMQQTSWFLIWKQRKGPFAYCLYTEQQPVSNATLGKLLRDGVERIWAFGGTSERRNGAHMGFSERIRYHFELNWTEQHAFVVAFKKCKHRISSMSHFVI